MELKTVIQDILKNKLSISYKNGKKHFLNGDVKYTQFKKVNNFTNIYGKVQDKGKLYFTQIRINNITNKIELICNCDLGTEVRKTGAYLPCEHIIATLLQFNKNNNIVINEKQHINIKLKLEENFTDEYKFKVYLFLEGNNRVKIDNRTYLQDILKKSEVFSFKNAYYSKENINLFNFLCNINFKITDKDIRDFFILCTNIDFTIKINSIEYKGKIKNEIMPLKFTIKLDNNKIRLQTLKTKIRSLNKDETVFLYNNYIYIPDINMCKAYKPIYHVLNKKFYTFVKKESLYKVIRVLENLGEVNIHDEVKNMLAKDFDIKLCFERNKEELYCKLNIPIEKEYLKQSGRIKEIEKMLFNNRFTKKGDSYYFLGEDFNIINLLKSGIDKLCEIESSNEACEISYSLKFIDIIKKDLRENNNIKVDLSGLKAQLRDYQKDGLIWLQNKKKKGLFGILADDMGLGKTIQVISFILNNKGDKTMIITPASLVYNWQDEFNKFSPELKVVCIHGTKSKRMEIIKNISEYDVVLTSYGTLNMDVQFYKDYIFDNLIIDEAQTIKNSKSKISQNVKAINSKVKFALTGTPIENNYLDIWNIFDFLKPGYLFSEKEFKEKFLNSEEQIKYLKLVIKPFILRRTKRQVLKELPDKIERTFYVDMTKEQKNYYKLSLRKFKKEAKENTNSITILSFLTRLRQIALDPSIIDDSYNGGSGKIDKALEIITRCLNDNKKIIVFSQFTSLLNKLKQKLDLLNKTYFYLDGSTRPADRVELCNGFNKSKDINIFLISLKAGGTGLNLTSAEIVLHFDPWWNPAVENQATDRAHRIGQKNQVQVIKIITKGTVEEKILKLKDYKNDIFSSLLDSDSDYNVKNNKLSREEIEYLLREDNIM